MDEKPRSFEQSPEAEDESGEAEPFPEWADEPGVFEQLDPAEEAAADARARADVAAGRYYDHEVVSQWLMTWGRPGRLPFREWLKQARS